jgi:hypothetical protein
MNINLGHLNGAVGMSTARLNTSAGRTERAEELHAQANYHEGRGEAEEARRLRLEAAHLTGDRA